MVPGIGGGELILIGVVALVVVGPKDLPKLLRQLGRFVGKMRRMADDFRTSFDDMARQSELDDLRKEVDALRSGKLQGLDDMTSQMKSIESDINSSLRAPVSPTAPSPVDIAPEPPLESSDPQMEGLPPRTADIPSEPKPKRVRKPKIVAEAESTAMPAKHIRAKKTVS